MANPRVAWGIDIGNRALKAVKLVRTADGVKIDDVDVIEHENILSNAGDNRDQLIQTALAVFTSKHQLKGAYAAVGVSGQQSFARFIKLPPVEERKIPEIVRFEAIQQIPFPLDEVEWAYQTFQQEGNPDVEVGIFAMRKELVNQHLANFGGSGLNVQAVQMIPLADYNALAYDDRIKGTTMIIDLGAENADLIIAEGENVWMRSIPIGGNHFTEALVRDFKLRFERAEELKRTTATSPHGRRILQAMRPVFADLVSEIQRSIGFYSSTHRDSRISRVLALGGTFKLPGLQKYLQQNLSLEVVKLDSLGQTPPSDAKVAAALNDNILSLVSAYGLGLQAMGSARINTSLLPQAIRRERFWQAKTKWFGAAAACMVVGTALSFVVAQGQQAAFDSADARKARSDVDGLLAAAKSKDSEWSAVQSGGGDDRKKIAEVKTLAEYRELWPTLYTQIDSSLPQPKAVTERANAKDKPRAAAPAPAKGATPVAGATGTAAKAGTKPASSPTDPTASEALAKFGPRNLRTEAVLEDLEVQYSPHIGDFVYRNPDGSWARDDTAFNAHVGQRDPSTYIGVRGRHGSSAGGTGMMGGIRAGGDIGPAPALQPMNPTPSAGASPDAGTATAGIPDKRGYWLTLHLTTPHKDGSRFIEESVVATLLKLEEQRLLQLFAPEDLKGMGIDPAKPDPNLTPQQRVQNLVDAFGKLPPEKRKTPKLTFTIARISVPSAAHFFEDQMRLNALITRAQAALERKRNASQSQPGLTPGVPGAPAVDPTQPNPALLPPPTGGASGMIGGGDIGVQPGFVPGAATDPNALSPEDKARLLVDPVTKENVEQDYVVTVLVAVVLDPLPESTPQPTQPQGEGSADSAPQS